MTDLRWPVGEQRVASWRWWEARTEHGLHEIRGFVHVKQRTRAQRVVQRVVQFAKVVEDLRGGGKRISDLVLVGTRLTLDGKS